jgi:RimJ/RimL family protein N-acetyltransferase
MLFNAIRENADRLQPWMPDLVTVGLGDIEAWVAEIRDKFLIHADMPFLLFLRDGKKVGDFIGVANIYKITREGAVSFGRIGYWLRRQYINHNYATEAVQGIALFAFRELCLRRLEIHCPRRNMPSQRVAQRAGFRLENSSLLADANSSSRILIFIKMS